MIEDVFKDCEKIAEEFEEKLINVVLRYAQIERKYQNRNISHVQIVEKTTEHFKSLYYGRQKQFRGNMPSSTK